MMKFKGSLLAEGSFMRHSRVGDGDLDFDSGFDGDGGDLLHDFRRRVKVNHALVNPHLKPIPSLGTFTTRCLSGGDAKNLSWHANRALDLQLLVFGTLDQISTHLF